MGPPGNERKVSTMFEREREWARSTGLKTGDRVRIISMNGEPGYSGREGTVTHIDDAGQIHGTWGGLALTIEDTFETV